MYKKYILFDLDGTLTDSAEGLTKAVAYALHHFGIEVQDMDSLRKYIGPPLTDSYMKFHGLTYEQATEGVVVFREYFERQGMFENRPYDGIQDALQKLLDKGKILIVATSKPEVYAKRILEHFELDYYFAGIYGSDLAGELTGKAGRLHKEEVIAYALEEMKIQDLSEAVMVGDREHDMIGAQKNGLDSVGVLYGFGSREELENNKATVIAETVADLKDLFD